MRYCYALFACLLSVLPARSEGHSEFSGAREQVWTVLTNRFNSPKTEALYDVLWRDLELRCLDKAMDGAEGPLEDDIRGSVLN